MAKSARCNPRQRRGRRTLDLDVKQLLLALPAFAAIAITPEPARAQNADCEPLREVHPLPGEALPANGSIWDICYYVADGERDTALPDQVCAMPKLFDAQGKPVQLELERRADGPPTRLISRYRPLTELAPNATYKLDPGAFSDPGGVRDVRIVPATQSVPTPPVIQALDYSVMGSSAEARFRFAPFQGLLVKDLGAQGSASLAAIDVSHVGADDDPRPTLLLARTPCRENFAAQPGASTNLRFGVFDLAGSFSGWGEPMPVQFPQTDTTYPAGAEEDSESGCALGGSQPAPLIAGWLVAVCCAFAARRRSFHSR